MPTTRGKRKSSSDTEMTNDKLQTNGKVKSQTNQWIMVVPKNFVATGSDGESLSPYLCKLPHPKSGVPALYGFKGTRTYEVMKFSDKFRSWFCNDSVHEDGSFYILSVIDPIFLAIPYLNKVAKKGKFMTLDQTFIDQNFQHGLSRLESCLLSSQLEELCDCRGPADLSAYKLNTEKLYVWLGQKVERLAEHLKTTNLHVGSGSQASNFFKSSNSSSYSHSDYMSYAFELVSDYIDDEFVQKLKEYLKIASSPRINKCEEEPPAKKQKINGGVTNDGCLEDYRDKKIKEAKKPVKLSTTQKQLAKVDKTGMKSLTSFFALKPK